jgi:hypothetical protein
MKWGYTAAAAAAAAAAVLIGLIGFHKVGIVEHIFIDGSIVWF